MFTGTPVLTLLTFKGLCFCRVGVKKTPLNVPRVKSGPVECSEYLTFRHKVIF